MGRVVLHWIVPGLLTVVLGTAATVLMTGPAVVGDLTMRSSQALAAAGITWALVDFDMRDAVLSGTASSPEDIEYATRELANVPGVRSVATDAIVAPLAMPYTFAAVVDDGVVTLSGGVPDAAVRADLALRADADIDQLQVLAGLPDRDTWLAAVAFGLDQLREFDEGEIRLSDLTLSIFGRAKSPRSFDILALGLRGGPPAGVRRGRIEVLPARASPYQWMAAFDGDRLAVSGFSPSAEVTERMRMASIETIPVSTNLVLASGEPERFADNTLLLLRNLVLLERGQASISDAAIRFSGAPATLEIAQAVTDALTPVEADVTLDPPRIDDYWFSAEYAADGRTLVLDGHVPDAMTLRRLGETLDFDVSRLELGRGAPERFASALDYGLDALSHMRQGRFSIRSTVLILKGFARTTTDYQALLALVAAGAPQGVTLALAEISAPVASPFIWSAEKGENGTVALKGYVPNASVRSALLTAIDGPGADAMSFADGEPEGFEGSALAGLGVLAGLDRGKVAYDGKGWSIVGAVDDPQQAFASESAFVATGLAAAGWSYKVSLPEPAPEVVLPAVDSYTWSVEKIPNGAITFNGYAPSDGFRRYLAERAVGMVFDNTALAGGAPDAFVADAMAGFDALQQLDEGRLSYAAGKWALSGRALSAPDRDMVLTILGAATSLDAWDVLVLAPEPPPAVAATYVWSAVKGADGSYALSGLVPTDSLRRFLGVRAGKIAADTMAVATGEPVGFVEDALAGLDALANLKSGSVAYDGVNWSLAGKPATPADADAALAALANATTIADAWVTSIGEAAVVVAQAEPGAEPAPSAGPTAQPEPAVEPEQQPAMEPEASVGSGPEATAGPHPAIEPEPAVEPEPAIETEAALEPEPEPGVELEASVVDIPDYDFSASRSGGAPIVLFGQVPADAAARYFGVIAGNVATDRLVVAEGAPEDFLPSAIAGIAALNALADGQLTLSGGKWSLSGKVMSEDERLAALAPIDSLPTGKDWATEIALPAAIDICRGRITAFAERNAILFQSGSALITAASGPALDELAADLFACPDASVHVEGHTDADGPEDLNLALSVARAEAVVEALIARGVKMERLYAVGYGESLPIAPNETADGKRLNRRIAFTILEAHT